MTDEENRQYLNIVKDENLLEEIQNPLSPKCIGWDRFSDLHIEIGFTNGASIKTKWAAGCLNLEDHIFKRIADFAIELKNKYIECDEFSHEIFEDDFDINDLKKVEEALPTLQGKSVIGLCFPCGGKC